MNIQLATRRALSHLRRDLTLQALDDFVALSSVPWEIQQRINPVSGAEVISMTRSVLEDLLSTGMVEVGDLGDGELVPWQTSIEATLSRIESAIRLDSPQGAGWLLATDKARDWFARYQALLDELCSERR